MSEVGDGLNVGVIRLGGADVQMAPTGIPITYFEHSPSLSHLNGIIGVTLTVGAVVPDGDTTRTIASIVTVLKCNIAAAEGLIGALQAALLLARPVEQPEHGKAN